MRYLDEIVSAQKRGEARGIASICSAHPTVLEASLSQARVNDADVLIESTCNQVNQFGGYTGMTPSDFAGYLSELSARFDLPRERLILGGDHLGPEVWQHDPVEVAMQKARRLVQDYVGAGFQKIHLDASMKLNGDSDGPLSKELAANRSAELARVAEDAYIKRGFGEAPRYVIGTEVPLPGGAREEDLLRIAEPVRVTRVSDAAETLEITRQAFISQGLVSAWERVIALVVQPGVEYGNDFVQAYNHDTATDLSVFIESENLVFEAHSTDYQTRDALRQMVADHFAILKVGPALTFAYREAVYTLAMMENALFPRDDCSNLIEVLDQVMLSNPIHWRKYYLGDSRAQRFARRFSYSDRSRYYWPHPEVQAALACLFRNLSNVSIPLSLISQYLPVQYWRIRVGQLNNDPHELVLDSIRGTLQDYWGAIKPKEGV
jgi:D-tagatose-1,6-bisphosphate aldolase subunit GatZ/KbaZ